MKWVLCLSFFWVACTTESKVKSAAHDGALRRVESELRAEASGLPLNKAHLRDTFVQILSERTEVDVEKVEVTGETARAFVLVKRVPAQQRRALLGIIQTLDPAKEAAFNVPNALSLIEDQMGKKEADSAGQRVILNLRERGGWQVLP